MLGIAQDQPPATSPPPVAAPVEDQVPGSIQGTVLSGATGQPLRRAQVLMSSVDSKSAALFQTTDEGGGFSFSNVAPGRYIINVKRDGYLPLSAGRIGDYKMPPIFSLNSGQTITSFVYRMTPSGVVSGKVKFDDAEPAVNVVVQLYRSYYDRGRKGFAEAARTSTDDRGEYRVHGLEPGSYYVAALYQASRPTWAVEQARTDSLGNPLPELTYAVTFFPMAQTMADAVPVKIAPGAEVGGIDIFLTLVHTVHVKGRVIGAIQGIPVAGPSISLRWNDPGNTGSVTAPMNVAFDQDQNFEIEGVTPGPYLLVASGTANGIGMTGRTPISVGDADVPNADVLILPESKWIGKVHLDDDDATLPSGLMIALQPRRSSMATRSTAIVSENGEFSIPFVPGETYDLYVLNSPDDVYLKSVRIANADRLSEGLEASPGATPVAVDVQLSSHGAQISGRAVTADPKTVASGASIALIPDPAVGRVQAYQTTHADEYGNFILQGIPPGKYLVVAWLDSAPCEIYNPDDLAACQSQGSSLTLNEGDQTNIQITAN